MHDSFFSIKIQITKQQQNYDPNYLPIQNNFYHLLPLSMTDYLSYNSKTLIPAFESEPRTLPGCHSSEWTHLCAICQRRLQQVRFYGPLRIYFQCSDD